MKRKQHLTVLAHIAVLVVVSFCGAYLLQRYRLVASIVASPPSNIAANCSVDDSAKLEYWLNGLPAGAVANFPTNGCYSVQGVVHLHNTNGLTINGNGSSFKRTDPAAISRTGTAPLLFLTQNTNLAINGLTLSGGYDGTSYGGPAYEGHYGLELECNHGVTLDSLNVVDIQGDFIVLMAPITGDTPGDHSLNTNIVVTNSRFNNAGYHGITIESANGATFSHNTFSNIKTDAMDFEYDIYSTGFSNGQPNTAAEDNISIVDNVWSNFNDPWFASYQGQSPGVQEQNIVLSGNTLKTGGPMLAVSGTPLNSTAQQYWNNGLTITNNIVLGPTYPVHGGSITVPFVGSTMEVNNVANLNISNNTMPAFDGTPTYFPNHPYLAVLRAVGVSGLTIKNNNFSGALGIIHPHSSDITGLVECANNFGVNSVKADSVCSVPSPPPPSGTGTGPTGSGGSNGGTIGSHSGAGTSHGASGGAKSTTGSGASANSAVTGNGAILYKLLPSVIAQPVLGLEDKLTGWYHRYLIDIIILVVALGLADVVWWFVRRRLWPKRDLSGGWRRIFHRDEYIETTPPPTVVLPEATKKGKTKP